MHTIHLDVCGLMPTTSHLQHLYFISFINNCTHYTQVYFMRTKNKVLFKLQAFISAYKHHSQVHMLKSNHSSEYISDPSSAAPKPVT